MKTLYIIHGWAYSIEPWQQTVDWLRENGVDVKQLRVPGLTEPSDEVWTIDAYVQWLRGQIADDPSPIVLGHSNGGRIAMHYDEIYPHHIAQLLLLSSAGIEVGSQKLSTKRRILKTVAKILAPLKHIPGARKIVYRLLKSDYNDAPENMKKTLANMLASDKDFDATNVTAPTAILWGEADTTTPLAMGKKLHADIKNSTFNSFPDWRHAPYRTHPTQLAEAIYAALQKGANQ